MATPPRERESRDTARVTDRERQRDNVETETETRNEDKDKERSRAVERHTDRHTLHDKTQQSRKRSFLYPLKGNHKTLTADMAKG